MQIATVNQTQVDAEHQIQDFTMTKMLRDVRDSLMEDVMETEITTRVCLNVSKLVDQKVNCSTNL